MKTLAIKEHGTIDYCGECGRTITGVPQFGFGWQSLPFRMYGKMIYDGDAAEVINQGGILIIPFCSESCRQKYIENLPPGYYDPVEKGKNDRD